VLRESLSDKARHISKGGVGSALRSAKNTDGLEVCFHNAIYLLSYRINCKRLPPFFVANPVGHLLD